MNENKNDSKLEYNVQQRARAGTAATFRGVVALYIAWLGYKLIRGSLSGESTLPAWAGWLVGVFFLAAALGFGYYIWRRWKADVEAARIVENDQIEEEDTPGQ